MPTASEIRAKRYLVTGCMTESTGYRVNRPGGCHDYLLVYTLGGNGRFCYRDQPVDVSENDLVLIAPDTPHRYEVAPNASADADANYWKLLWTHFQPPAHWKPWLQWSDANDGFGKIQVKSEEAQRCIVDRLQEANRLLNSFEYHREMLAINALEAALLWCDAQYRTTQSGGDPIDARIQNTLNFICQNLDQQLSIAGLSQKCHLSESRFAHLFRDQMKITPQQFLEQQRIDRAKKLLEHTGLTIQEIAIQVGYSDPFHFSKRFKKNVGESPSSFRKQAHSVNS